MNKLNICVVTSSRADYSHLYYLLCLLKESEKIDLSLIATGTHLSREFGYTLDAIKSDGFDVTKEVDILENGSSKISITKSMGNGLIKFADVFDELKPDLLLILGDRFEMLSVVTSAMIAGIPIAHIGGGDVTEGAFDDAIRHSITKMSHIHFVTNKMSQQRVAQMGENLDNIYVTGAPSLDIINNMDFMSKSKFLNSVGLEDVYDKYILLTYHPETLSDSNPIEDLNIVLAALNSFNVGIIITGANTDTGGDIINQALQEYANGNDNTVFHMSLGKDRFYNALKHVNVFVGNSSSGLYEAPSFKLPVVNIGDRQKSRLSAESVIDCALNSKDVKNSIEKAFELDCSKVISPYGNGTASKQMLSILEGIDKPKDLLRKAFYVR